jgi:hexosaminidase
VFTSNTGVFIIASSHREIINFLYDEQLTWIFMRFVFPIFLAVFAMLPMAQAQSSIAKSPDAQSLLMPLPASLRAGTGQLAITQSFTVAITGAKEARITRAAQRLIERLALRTGIPLSAKLADPSRATLVLTAEKAGKPVQELGEDESYTLDVTPNGARITAPNPLGILRGVETFLQLLQIGPSSFFVPAVRIEDRPRFPWRGLMIDSCRHWIPAEVIKRNLDGMAAVKLNVFHWHLSENQAFRIESKKFPKLHEMGSNGLYYSQEQVREVIAYARERGIRVIPEFDMPGHSSAWFIGYPQLASAPGPYHLDTSFGVFDPAMDPTRDSTYKFLDTFIGEMSRLFPDKFFHIGGDEVNGKRWLANPKIRAFMKKRHMETAADLQAYFNRRVQAIVKKHGKTMIGWDEVVHNDLPTDTLIQSWRGPKGLAQAARSGYRTILSNGYYIDLMWPASQHYAVEPMSGDATTLTPEQQSRILGGEATMWSELVTAENIDSRIWPRTAAIAERFWSPQNVTDVGWMYRRLAVISDDLTWLGLTHQSYYDVMLRRIIGSDNIQPLRTLADVLEPPKGYERHSIDKLNTDSPFNRLVDALHPESDTARSFSQLVDHILANTATPAEKAQARALLIRWRDNDAKLQPALEDSFLAKELAPVSQSVSKLAIVGLEALDALDSGTATQVVSAKLTLTAVQQPKKPTASVTIMIVNPIQRLVNAAKPANTAEGK